LAGERVKKRFSLALRLGLVLVVLGAFGWYLIRHGELVDAVQRAPRWVLGLLVLLYVAWFATLVGTVHATFAICGRRLGAREEFLLNAYSTLTNFFVPGQGGVAVRGVYMKKRYGLALRTYSLATFLYYACFAAISGLFVVVPTVSWRLSSILAFAMAALGMALLRLSRLSRGRWLPDLRITPWTLSLLAAWTVANCLVQAVIYWIELRAVLPAVHWSQVFTYTGAANFAQFAALTPGAIGIRESFLLFTERLHGIPTQVVLAASILDRASFVLFLGALFGLSLASHARRTYGVGNAED
jgi:uncharacterized membrane protein YbhN (UPF0104 family)